MPEPDTELASVPRNDIYGLLQSDIRRVVIRYLATHENSQVGVEAIVDHLAGRLGRERRECYVSLIHSHLMKFQKAGVIEFDAENETVYVSEGMDTVFEAMVAVEDTLADS